MTSFKASAAVFGLFILAGSADAADVGKVSLPAVSGLNAKIEASFGFVDLNNFGSDEEFRGGASFSMPLGESFGFQGDLAVVDVFDDTMIGGTAHLFTRDPGSYLFGMIGGAGFGDNANIYYAGPEAEFYLDQLSLELAGGYMNVDRDNGGSKNKMFAFADVAFYATDDLRLSLGASSVAGFSAANAAAELQLSGSGLPLSLTLNGSVGEDGYMAASVGFKMYFGQEDKSLIRRHREDDPRNRSLDIFSSAGNAFANGPAASAPTGPIIGECPPGEVDVDPGPGTSCVFEIG